MTAYTDLATLDVPVTGGLPPASWGQGVRDNFEWMVRDSPTAGVYNSTNIAVVTGLTPTALTFDSERWDNASVHSTSSNSGRLTVPTGSTAKFLVAGSVVFDVNSSGTRQVGIRKNGTTFVGRHTSPAAAGGFGTHLSIARVVTLSAGDYVELTAAHDVGANLNVLYLDAESPNFELFFYRY